MRKEYETTLIIDGEIQGASIPRAPRGVAAKYRADPGYRVTDVSQERNRKSRTSVAHGCVCAFAWQPARATKGN